MNDNLALFLAEYKRQFLIDREKNPRNHMMTVDAEVVLERMTAAIQRGSFSKDSASIRATCRHFKIPHTYKAINAFIWDSPNLF